MPRFLCRARAVAYGILAGGGILLESVVHLITHHLPPEALSRLGGAPGAVRVSGWLAICSLAAGIGMVISARRRSQENSRRESDLRADALVVRRQRAELRARSAAMVDQLRRTSHNIRSPLMNVLGSVDLLLSSGLHAEATTQLHAVRSNTQHILTLANELLDLAASASAPLGDRDVDPEAMLIEIAASFSDRAARAGVVLTLVWDSPAPPLIRTDPTRCREILTNLIDNALRHTERGAVRIEAGYEDESKLLRLRVIDSGCGISPDRIEALFDPGSRTGQVPGRAGVGLVITRHLAEAMGGSIEVRSRVGEGSCFTVTLPAARPAAPSARVSRGWGAVLVVDDAPEVLAYMRAVVRKAGYEVATAEGVDAALQALEADPGIGTVLIDRSIPDAPALLRRLRECAPPRRVVAFSGDVTPGAEGRAVAAGFDAFLPKPFTDAALAGALARAPSGRSRAA